ncbi:MAG: MarP family serine protease [Actinomycetota bacterium]
MNEFNWVDLVIGVFLVSSGIRGYVQGAFSQVTSYLGFGVGLFLGAHLGPSVSAYVDNPIGKMIAVVVVLFGAAGVLGTVGRVMGAKATWGFVRVTPARITNSLGGVGVAVLAGLIGVWLLGGMIAQVGLGTVSPAFQQSQILRSLTRTLPPVPGVFSQIQRIFLPSGFPPVFAELEPSIAPDVPLAESAELQAIVDSVGTSVVKISSPGCGRITSGSGFVAGQNLVITNAHVVAGVAEPTVADGNGPHRAEVVLFDPDLDFAVLRTSGLAGSPLPLLRSEVERGVTGGVLGYPEGGPFDAKSAAVRAPFKDAVGRDIYSRDLVSRDIYQLDARVRSGNSGGPFVQPSGEVVGVVFASSLINDNIAYALTSAQVAPLLDQVGPSAPAVGTGPCPF